MNYPTVLIQCQISISKLYQIYNKKHEILATTLPIYTYINRISNRLVFKIEDGSKLKLQTPVTIKFSGIKNKMIDKTKNGENVPSFEVIETVLVKYNLVDNQNQQRS